MKDCAAACIYNRRQILRETAKVFDPLGYFSPVLINTKLLLGDLWKNDLDVDEIISPEKTDCQKKNTKRPSTYQQCKITKSYRK